MGKTLYRDPVNGKIGGICAGIAEYFGIETWIVRIAAVVAFFLGFGVATTIAYLAAMLMIEKKPIELYREQSNAYFTQRTQGAHHQEANAQGEHMNLSPEQALADIENTLTTTEGRIREMEGYVTSREFELNRKFNQL